MFEQRPCGNLMRTEGRKKKPQNKQKNPPRKLAQSGWLCSVWRRRIKDRCQDVLRWEETKIELVFIFLLPWNEHCNGLRGGSSGSAFYPQTGDKFLSSEHKYKRYRVCSPTRLRRVLNLSVRSRDEGGAWRVTCASNFGGGYCGNISAALRLNVIGLLPFARCERRLGGRFVTGEPKTKTKTTKNPNQP